MAFLGEQELTRRRFDPTTWTDGRPTPGAVTESTFWGSVQPMPEIDRQVLPEGVRQRDGRKLYCARGTLRVEDQHAQTPGDEVVIDGTRFTVVHVDSSHAILPHDRAYLVRVQEASP